MNAVGRRNENRMGCEARRGEDVGVPDYDVLMALLTLEKWVSIVTSCAVQYNQGERYDQGGQSLA